MRDLTEFLLARIAEDEVNIRRDERFWATPKPSRALAEAQAKRRMVEALRSLASAYADHPDYDESWRP